MRLRALVLASGLLCSTSAFAQDKVMSHTSGNELFDRCNDGTTGQIAGELSCLAWVAGASDVLSFMRIICPPEDVTVGRMRDVLMRFLRDHPQDRHMAASYVAGVALWGAFPCKK